MWNIYKTFFIKKMFYSEPHNITLDSKLHGIQFKKPYHSLFIPPLIIMNFNSSRADF